MGGFILVKDCVCSVMQHWRALGLGALDWGRGGRVRGWRWDQELWGWGAGRMLHSGCRLALKSHLAGTLSPHPEGGWRTGGRGRWDGPGHQLWGNTIGYLDPPIHWPISYQMLAQLPVRKDIHDDPEDIFNLCVAVMYRPTTESRLRCSNHFW